MSNPKDRVKSTNSLGEVPFVLPANLPAERCVLGAVIEDDSLLPKVLALGLRADSFLLPDHRRIFQAIETLYSRNAPVDYVSVIEQLGNRNQDFALIADLMHGVVLYEDHILHHAHIVRKKAQLRALLRISEWITKAISETAEPDVVTAQIRDMLAACSED